jgi:hypothetical protein
MTGAGIAKSQYAPCSLMPGNRVDEILPLPLAEHGLFVPPSSSSSTVSYFGGRLEASAPSLSSLRTTPSWQSSLGPDVRKTNAKIKARYDGEDFNTHNQPHPCGETLMPRSQHSSSSDLKYFPARCRSQDKPTTGQNDYLHISPLVDLPGHISHAMTVTNKHKDQSSDRSSSSSTDRLSFGDPIPFPSTSEESYPSPYSADAIAVFQAPPYKGGARYFEGRRKREDILEDQVQVVFAVAVDGTSTSSGTASLYTAPRLYGPLEPLRRRVKALASSLLSTRRKFPTIFTKKHRAPHFDDHDYTSVEYDIPCLAYISCLW